jgi:GNAT superfamily N-acetyltransferase
VDWNESYTPTHVSPPWGMSRRILAMGEVTIAPAQGRFINWTGKLHADPREVSDGSFHPPVVLNAFDGDTVVGSIIAYTDAMVYEDRQGDPDTLLVESVWVDPSYRREGVGTKLIEAAKQATGATKVLGQAQTLAGKGLLKNFS